MHEKILTLAKAIVRPAEEEEALLDALCTAAEAELTGRLRELASFFGCRALTGVLDVGIMAFCVDFMGQNGLLWKFISNVLVVVLNYIASKWFIFKKN